ncbi:amino acid permease [Sporolituus thermophilus]|uniref:Amino acid/polyamine/organocation transporter, APC superfamily (TC 2.A.3) n=1 Tax=Sporolituus thermophilus DSM 23256 TaxID=1123285 RepID=A0A1G7IMG1_9FIRM|nr:amino acid permease [Sporolituus thermophilus]SDF13932.1 amino acid/polyamine/organocation transporter, APC superfamily (TC 2.A.3) [Sporolituus thermophilus DSM 23256]
MKSKPRPELKKGLGLAAATALVMGNMIGSGIFMMPNTLANSAGPGASLLAWAFTGIGSILLALTFANLGSRYPQTGGPYAFSKMAFGEFTGFINAWSYWIGAIIGNAAILTAFASYLSFFFPIVKENGLVAFTITSFLLWFFTLINIKGVREAGLVTLITTILKVVPLIVFVIVGAGHFDLKIAGPMFPEGKGIETISAAATATLWAFIGLESATVAAGEIQNPERNVRLSTIWGIGLTTVLYLAISLVAMGTMSQDALAQSSSPLADILNQYSGGWGSEFIALGALVSTLGATAGWVLSTARISFAAAEDGLLPKGLASVHPKFATPHTSLIVSGIIANVILILNYVDSLTAAYNFMILLATLSFLPPYVFAAAAEILLLSKRTGQFSFGNFIKNSFLSLLGFAYALWTIYGSGAEAVMYGFLLILIGIPVYLYMKLSNQSVMETANINS